jgi:hypothetical protein
LEGIIFVFSGYSSDDELADGFNQKIHLWVLGLQQGVAENAKDAQALD